MNIVQGSIHDELKNPVHREEYKINKILVIGVPENSEQSSRQPTPPFHSGNMDDLCKPPPLFQNRTGFNS